MARVAIDGLAVYNAIQDKGGWDWWANPNRRGVEIGGYAVDVVQVKDDDSNGREGVWQTWDEAPQGWTGEAYIIFKVTEDDFNYSYFKKFGTISSYLAVTWDGKFIPVTPKVKQVTEYVYE